MKHTHTLALLAALAGQVACSKGCGEDLPSPDICSGPREGAVDEAELGQGEFEDFVPLVDDDIVRFVYADDGKATLPITFRLAGDDVPRCVDHRTALVSCGPEQDCDADGVTRAELIAPLHAYPPEEGVTTSGETHVLYLPLDRANEPEEGDQLELVSTIAGIELRVRLWLERHGDDASVDAGP